MSHFERKTKFLNLPRYGGGAQEFKQFISQNLKYPQAALEAGIEGSVLVEYEIDGNGFVHNSRVLNGIGYGCDEEALRVIGLLRFKKVKNKGVRVRVTTKTTIHFRLPATVITYTITSKQDEMKPQQPSTPAKDDPITYGYTIQF